MNSGLGFLFGKGVVDNINNDAANVRQNAETGGLDAQHYQLERMLNDAVKKSKEWQKRSIRTETSRDAWRMVLKELVQNDKHPEITKDAVNKRYHELFDEEVENNIKDMQVKARD